MLDSNIFAELGFMIIILFCVTGCYFWDIDKIFYRQIIENRHSNTLSLVKYLIYMYYYSKICVEHKFHGFSCTS